MTSDLAVAVSGIGIRLPDVSGPAGYDWESSLAVAAASAAVSSAKANRGAPVVGPVGAVWATSTAGHGNLASEVSRRLYLTGPYISLTGTRDAGAQAFVEAVHMVQQGLSERIVVGASAGRDRESAVCIVLDTRPVKGDVVVRPVSRTRLDWSDVDGQATLFLEECLARLAGPPEALVLSADTWCKALRDAASRLCLVQCCHVEQQFGDLGAVGGLVAAAQTQQHDLTLVIAVGETGNAVALELATWNGDPRWT
jgi:hypothetical protein